MMRSEEAKDLDGSLQPKLDPGVHGQLVVDHLIIDVDSDSGDDGDDIYIMMQCLFVCHEK